MAKYGKEVGGPPDIPPHHLGEHISIRVVSDIEEIEDPTDTRWERANKRLDLIAKMVIDAKEVCRRAVDTLRQNNIVNLVLDIVDEEFIVEHILVNEIERFRQAAVGAILGHFYDTWLTASQNLYDQYYDVLLRMKHESFTAIVKVNRQRAEKWNEESRYYPLLQIPLPASVQLPLTVQRLIDEAETQITNTFTLGQIASQRLTEFVDLYEPFASNELIENPLWFMREAQKELFKEVSEFEYEKESVRVAPTVTHTKLLELMTKAMILQKHLYETFVKIFRKHRNTLPVLQDVWNSFDPFDRRFVHFPELQPVPAEKIPLYENIVPSPPYDDEHYGPFPPNYMPEPVFEEYIIDHP